MTIDDKQLTKDKLLRRLAYLMSDILDYETIHEDYLAEGERLLRMYDDLEHKRKG